MHITHCRRHTMVVMSLSLIAFTAMLVIAQTVYLIRNW